MLRRTAILAIILCSLPCAAFARAGDWQHDNDVAVRLISSIDGTGQEQIVPLGLEITLNDSWHTYWRSPGIAGLPPQIDWQNDLNDGGNLKTAMLLYPAPTRYSDYGLETIGYRDHVVFPIDAALRIPGQALQIDATLNLLVCSAICVPKTFPLSLTVPAGEARESPEAPLIKGFRDQVPGSATNAGLAVKSILYDGAALHIDIESRDTLSAPDIFIENSRNIAFKAPLVEPAENRHSATLVVQPEALPDNVELVGMPLTLTIVNGGAALEQKIKVPAITRTPAAPPVPVPLGGILLFALIGGFILNLMPCVLPVLSLKIFSAIGHGGGESKLVRRSFLVTAAGIVFSFLALALMTIALKELGLTLGWGVQFQQPEFLIFLILLLTFFAANMWGLLDIHLPHWFADSISTTRSYHPKLIGDFVTGALATLLATPCSAPFLGTAVGFALTSGPRSILLVFATLGFGMTIPYIAVALFPRLATALPKPGPWMVHLRVLLGGALAATALWLIWVLAAQITVRFAMLAGLCMAGILLLLALRKRGGASRGLLRMGLLDFTLVAIGLTIAGAVLPKPLPEVDRQWLPFSVPALEADLVEGKTVFVDITADWCLTCKANKKFVLSQDDIGKRLFHQDIIAMQADWTNPDPVIADFLHRYGRYGIPFNAAFGPGAPQGLVLPELLTHDAVMDALEKARTTPKQ